jgi:hypothetical protein
MAHEVSNFLDTVKARRSSLSDAEYLEGMNLCKKVYEKKAKKNVYRMVYLRPHTQVFTEDPGEFSIGIGYNVATTLVQLSIKDVEFINKHHCYNLFTTEDSEIVDSCVFRGVGEIVGNEVLVTWMEVPVISISTLEN